MCTISDLERWKASIQLAKLNSLPEFCFEIVTYMYFGYLLDDFKYKFRNQDWIFCFELGSCLMMKFSFRNVTGLESGSCWLFIIT